MQGLPQADPAKCIYLVDTCSREFVVYAAYLRFLHTLLLLIVSSFCFSVPVGSILHEQPARALALIESAIVSKSPV
jgi:hypothetical protein